jgi:group I intron endonuclease
MLNNQKYPSGCGIYAIEHIESGRRYVGSSINVARRLSRHVSNLNFNRHHSKHLQSAWNLYGERAFVFLLVARCSEDELLEFEQLEIDMNDSYENGFNCAKFSTAPMRGRSQTEEAKAKMRESHKSRKPISEETRENHRKAAIEREAKKKEKGFIVSEETREKLRNKGIGREVSSETRQKISDANRGKTFTEERKRKISDAHKGKIISEEAREKISNANRGKKRSDEFRKKMSDIAKNRSDETKEKMGYIYGKR